MTTVKTVKPAVKKPKTVTVKIDVTQDMIDKGIRGNTSLCPIAKALRAAGLKRPSVGTYAFFDMKKERYQIELPKKALTFITHFDGQGRNAVKPFSFNLRYKLDV